MQIVNSCIFNFNDTTIIKTIVSNQIKKKKNSQPLLFLYRETTEPEIISLSKPTIHQANYRFRVSYSLIWLQWILQLQDFFFVFEIVITASKQSMQLNLYIR